MKKEREPNQFNVGEWIERAAWCDEILQVPGACRELAREFGRLEVRHRVKFAPLAHEILHGDDKRISGPRQGKYVAIVYAKVQEVKQTQVMDVSWVHDLRADDLRRLREATKTGFARAKPHFAPMTDAEADIVIGIKGPQLARKMLENKLFEVGGTMLKAANDMPAGDQ